MSPLAPSLFTRVWQRAENHDYSLTCGKPFLCSIKEKPIEELAEKLGLGESNASCYAFRGTCKPVETWLWWTNARASIYFASFSRNEGSPLCLDDFAPCPAFLRSSQSLYGLERVAGGRCWQLFWALNRIGGKVLAHVAGFVLPVFAGSQPGVDHTNRALV